MKKNKNAMLAGRQGFTLFELLVSISIIGIMMALAIVSYSAAQKKARDSRRIQDISTIGKAAEQFYSQAGYVYPASSDAASWVTGGTSILNLFPVDPKNTAPYIYTYNSVAPYTAFCACAALENAVGNSNDATCTNYVNGGLFYCINGQQ